MKVEVNYVYKEANSASVQRLRLLECNFALLSSKCNTFSIAYKSVENNIVYWQWTFNATESNWNLSILLHFMEHKESYISVKH
jgi:hypothetical protein